MKRHRSKWAILLVCLLLFANTAECLSAGGGSTPHGMGAIAWATSQTRAKPAKGAKKNSETERETEAENASEKEAQPEAESEQEEQTKISSETEQETLSEIESETEPETEKKGFFAKLSDAAGSAKEKIIEIAGSAMDKAKDLSGKAIDKAKGLAGKAGDALSGTGKKISETAGTVKDKAKGLAGKVRGALSGAGKKIGHAAGSVKDKAGDLAGAAKDRARGLAGAAKDKVRSLSEGAREKTAALFGKIGGWLQRRKGTAESWFAQLGQKVRDRIEFVKEKGRDLREKAGEIAGQVGETYAIIAGKFFRVLNYLKERLSHTDITPEEWQILENGYNRAINNAYKHGWFGKASRKKVDLTSDFIFETFRYTYKFAKDEITAETYFKGMAALAIRDGLPAFVSSVIARLTGLKPERVSETVDLVFKILEMVLATNEEIVPAG